MALQTWGSLLLTATARDGLHGWDLRADKNAFRLSGTPHQVGVKPTTAGLLASMLTVASFCMPSCRNRPKICDRV